MASSEKDILANHDTSPEVPSYPHGSQCPGAEKPDELAETKPQSQPTAPLYHKQQLGVWTLYFPVSDAWKDSLPALASLQNVANLSQSARIVWRFLVETFTLSPLMFSLYFVTLTLARIMPSIQLYNDSKLMNLAEQALVNHAHRTLARKEFERALVAYLITLMAGWIIRRLNAYSEPILQQRVSFHFQKRVLSVRCRLDLGSLEDPAVESVMTRATNSSSNAWSILQGVAEVVAVISETVGLVSALKQLLESHQGAKTFALTCLIPPLVSELHWIQGQTPFYAIITNTDWLNMRALFALGTQSTYKKEVLSSGLEGHIDSQYAELMSRLGDIREHDPEEQLYLRRLFDWSDFGAIFDSIPLLIYAWGNIQNWDNLNLSGLVMMQKTIGAAHSVIWHVISRGSNISNLFKNVVGLYEALEFKPKFVDGHVAYPDEQHLEQKGMEVEFRGVSFAYPSSKRQALKDMSFRIAPGQLCVIVGENGCGKSTTISLITRLYDCNSGDVLIDGRPVRDYKVSTLRTAANIMYQDYQHLPMTINENILLGRPDSKNPEQDIEDAARLGGAYDFVQKLPQKFNTNLEPMSTGYASWSIAGNSVDKYKSIAESEKSTKLSGGEWQRLALSRTFMKNSEKTRLLCYDEPSASLDPKAEYEIFERLRELRGEKTMIFVTHRFGHLTKHADLIIYVKDGSVLEQGTHKSLLAQGGEYAKMYNIQSEAFSD